MAHLRLRKYCRTIVSRSSSFMIVTTDPVAQIQLCLPSGTPQYAAWAAEHLACV